MIARTAALPALLLSLLALLVASPGCQSDAQTGLVAGAGIGALMGQAIGGNTAGTLIGTGVGAGIGYIIGNERDKARAEQLHRDSMSAGGSGGGGGRSTSRPAHNEVGGLGGTRWNLVSLNPRDRIPPFSSAIVEFRNDGRVFTTRTAPDGSVTSAEETFRVVGDTLIVNRPGYIVNARFQVSGNQLILSAPDFSAVLERLPG